MHTENRSHVIAWAKERIRTLQERQSVLKGELDQVQDEMCQFIYLVFSLTSEDRLEGKKRGIVENTILVLNDRCEWLGTQEILDELLNRGWTSSAKSPYQSVSATLSQEVRKAAEDHPRLVRKGTRYGLPDWLENGVPYRSGVLELPDGKEARA